MFGEAADLNGEKKWTLERIHELFPILKERANYLGSRISGGEQQMLVIGRALMQNPKLILMDEICEGLAPKVVQELAEVINELKRQGVSILLCRAEREVCACGEQQVLYNGEGQDSLPREDGRNRKRCFPAVSRHVRSQNHEAFCV